MTAKRGNRLEEINQGARRVNLPSNGHKPCSYRDVDPGILKETLQVVALAGGALRLGFTRDGGAFAIGVYGDGDPYTVYCAPSEDITATLRAIRDGFDIIGNSRPAAGRDA